MKMLAMQAPLTLVSFDLCPYVQRAAIVLAEKAVPFRRVDIDLSDKPGWFTAISPLGKVPLLKVGDEVLFESAVIVEYLEETQDNPLHPKDPLTKARHRAWMEFGSTILADIWIVETTADATVFAARIETLKAKFARLESELGVGPCFAGASFSIVDAVFAPAFRYFEGLPKVRRWREALAVRPSVRNAVIADYPERLQAFLKRHGGVITRFGAAIL
jgi:glutathione S-transferase